jgi:SLT domain-containing protein
MSLVFDFASRGAGQVADDFAKTSSSAALASKNVRLCADALDRQEKAGKAAASGLQTAERVSALLAVTEHELDKEIEKTNRALVTQGIAAKAAGKGADDARGGFAGLVGEVTGFGAASTAASSKSTLFARGLAGINLASGVLEPALAGVVVAAGGAAAAFASAAIGAGVFAAVAGGVFAKAKGGADKFTKAQDALNAATTSAQRQKALADQKAAFQGLTGSQVQLAKGILSVKSQWGKFIDAASPGVVKPAVAAMGLLPRVFQIMKPFLAPVEHALTGIIGQIRQGIAPGTAFSKIMGDFAAHSGKDLSLILQIVGHLFMGLLGAVHTFLPTGEGVLRWADQASAKFQKWGLTLSSHTGFQSLMTTFRTETPQAMAILRNLGTVLANVGKAMFGLSTFSNSRMLLSALLPLSGVMASLSKNTDLVRVAMYALLAVKIGQQFTWLPGAWKGMVKFAAATEGATVAQVIAAAATRAWGLAMMALPWVALAAAVIAVAVLIIKYHRQIWAFAQRVWHDVLAVIMACWHWVQRNWPLLLAIIAGPIGIATLAVIKNWRAITSAGRTAWLAVAAGFRWLVNQILGVFSGIIHGAAAAFGWVPGLGGKLRGAAAAFDRFRANVNKSLGGINGRTVNVSVAMTSSSNPYPGGISGRKAAGGRITGPGGPADDRAGLYALSNNEWVIRANSASRYGPAEMAAVNEGRAVIGYAAGGGVGVNVHPSAPGYAAITTRLMGSIDKLAAAFGKASAAMSGPAGSAGGGVQQWRGLVLQALAMEGLPAGLAGNVLYQMQTESGGNSRSINLWDSNAARGTPSIGLLQVIAPTFARWHWPGTSWNIYDPLANIAAAINYSAHGRGFGSGPGQMGSGHGYAYGTSSAAPGWAWVGERGPELMRFRGGEQIRPAAAGGGNTYNITVNVPPTASKADTGRVIVEHIREYERGSGARWRK